MAKEKTKTIITVATTGAWPTKKDNPAVPLTPREIADDVFACYEAGAAIAHLHMRDAEGKGTMDKAKFVETVKLIKERKDVPIIINLTTSGAANPKEEDRYTHIQELRPEMASFDAGSMNWMNTVVFLNTPPFLEKIGRLFQEINVKPEIEVFDAGMLYNALYYIKTGVLKAPLHFQFVLGAAGGMTATVENLVFLKNLIPAGQGHTWSALGIGKGHVPIMFAAIALGGHLRVGMEDNVMFSATEPAESNAQLVKRAADIVRLAGNEVATPAEAKQILSITR